MMIQLPNVFYCGGNKLSKQKIHTIKKIIKIIMGNRGQLS